MLISVAFDKFAHALLGVYIWECVISFDFDWQIITRQKRFYWPMIFYFLNRYFMLFAVIGLVVGMDVRSEINCKALFIVNAVTGASAIGLASINLSLRTMAVWSMRWYIVVPLIVTILAHFALLLQIATLTATWITGRGCVITYTDNSILMAAFIYTIVFDFFILLLMAVKLFKTTTTTGSHSRLRTLIFKDGLIYFIVAFLSNVVAAVTISLNISPITSVITNLPATIFSTIVACRVVRRLNNYPSYDPEIISAHTQFSSLALHTSGLRPSISDQNDECVRMETSSSEAKVSPT